MAEERRDDAPTKEDPAAAPETVAEDGAAPDGGAPPAEDDEPADGRITLYRVLVGALVVILIGAWVFFDHVHNVLVRRIAGLEHQLAEARAGGGMPPGGMPPGAPPPGAQPPGAELEVPVIDVADRFAHGVKAAPERPEGSESYLSSKQGTVSLRFVGREQVWPLHLRRRSEEVSVVVSGTLDLKQIYGKDGKLATVSTKVAPGVLFSTPQSTGAEWANPSKTDSVGALVFTVPPADGSTYVKADDERLAKGAEPWSYDPTDDLAKVAAGAEASVTKKVPFFGDRASLLLVKSEAKVPRDPMKLRTLFVLRGAGTVDGGKPVPLQASNLVILKGATPVTVKAQGAPIAALVFDAEILDPKAAEAKPAGSAAPAASAAPAGSAKP
jgi:hypothetical protein